ncbi:zinc alcohol dehydrogenase [Collybia nuda]|uniref:Zinc alcohol dehydrogenase n=1 Tax=Collybia nuda TaxID=64659 RepID=A0A9P5YC81_9AGAR|nr:zinc alcohol dehydrogenase [Collybia nuda]
MPSSAPSSSDFSSYPTVTKGWTYITPGPPSSLVFNPCIPVPALTSPTSVLVHVSYCALNIGSTIAMQLFPSFLHPAPTPWVPELDFSGTITSIGPDVLNISNDLMVGAEVFGAQPMSAHLKFGSGSLAEYLVVEAKFIVCKPPMITYAEAAGLGIVGCTSLLLVRRARLKRGDKVLINGGSGGAGSLVVQLVRKEVGDTGKIVVVCSGHNADLVKDLGADEVVDYKTHAPVHSYLSAHYSRDPFDSIIDAVGIQELYFNCGPFLAIGKPYVSIGVKMKYLTRVRMIETVFRMIQSSFLPRILGGGTREYAQVVMMEASRADLEELRKLVHTGDLKGVVDSIWEMDDALKAYDRCLNHSLRGKVIIKVRSSDESVGNGH